jgi:hypothetical protein
MKRRLAAALLFGTLAGLAARAVVGTVDRPVIRILVPPQDPQPGAAPADAEVWKLVG